MFVFSVADKINSTEDCMRNTYGETVKQREEGEIAKTIYAKEPRHLCPSSNATTVNKKRIMKQVKHTAGLRLA
jgi:hypothetical protein